MQTRVMLAMLMLVFGLTVMATCCTGICVASNGTALFGNNEDKESASTFLWFSPAPAAGGFGGVYYGFADRYPQGGMNERGLSFDQYGQPILPVTGSDHLPTPPFRPRNGEWIYRMLEECESVDEALEYLSQYDLWFFERFQLFLADRFGDAAVVEGDCVIRKTGDRLVVTDFLLSQPGLGNYPCARYAGANAVLRQAICLSQETLRDALDAAHTSLTCYSNIHDPSTGDVTLYAMHDFENAVRFNVLDELEYGEREFGLTDLFEVATRRTPLDGTRLNGVDVEFSWYGKAVEYEIVVSTDPCLDRSAVYLAVGCTTCASSRRISRTVVGLQPQTTYYWTLRAKGDEGFWTETSVYTLRTGSA